MGNNDEIFKLSDGSIWQVKYEYGYLYEYFPSVVICPHKGILIIESDKLNVVSISGSSRFTNSDVIESRIDGDFEGWEGETIVKLINGQIWEQAEYYYEYHYAYSPEVLVYRSRGIYKMQVEGIDEPVRVDPIR